MNANEITKGPWKCVGGGFNDDGTYYTLDINTFSKVNANVVEQAEPMLRALQHLVEVYDDPTGKQWTTTSKREALDKAREAINLALGE